MTDMIKAEKTMKGYEYIKKAILSSVAAAVVVFGAAAAADGRSAPDKYRKYQSAKARAEMRYQAYLVSGRMSDFHKWQKDVARMNRRYDKWQRKGGMALDDSMTTDLTPQTTTEIPIANTTETTTEDMNTNDLDQSTVSTSDMPQTTDNKENTNVTATDDPTPDLTRSDAVPQIETPVSPPPIVNDPETTPVTTDDPQVPVSDNPVTEDMQVQVTPPVSDTQITEPVVSTGEPLADTSSMDDADSNAVPERALTRSDEKAREVVVEAYIDGHKQGEKDLKHGHAFSDASHMSFSVFIETRPNVGHKYRPFYEDGYKKGYQDGYNNTKIFGERTETGYSVYSRVLDKIVDTAP